MIEIKRIDPDWFQTSNLFFKDDGPVSKGAKTRRFSVLSRTTRSLLGYIKWYPNWRKYCFFPLNSLFDDKCLRQVAQFCEEATTTHKARLPNIQRQKEMEKARRQRRIEQLTKQKECSTISPEVIQAGKNLGKGLLANVIQEAFSDENRVVEGMNVDAPVIQETT
jgi:hypothetical protein